MKKIITFIFILSSLVYSAQIKSYLRKANKAFDNNKIDIAFDNFHKAYAIDAKNFEANFGLGFILCEFKNKYEEALPYLQTAYSQDIENTTPDLVYALAVCYNYHKEFTIAQELYTKLAAKIAKDKIQETYTTKNIEKRINDCIYAKNHLNTIDSMKYVANIGSQINTPMPEYVPVLINENELLFTSRRKDSNKEGKSKIDGKYFENIYISQLINGRPQVVKIYDLTNSSLKTNSNKKHISIVSASSDGKTMFVFLNNKIHEITEDANHKKTVIALSKNVNMDFYQNHACISKDGNTLLFTSEDEKGNGGLDIYKTTKSSNGEWSDPENLGKTINTPFDEDAPYLSNDGKTLYFSSKGHDGFGNYDIYKSNLIDGKWSAPENLKQPINSPGNDIFLVQSNNNDFGYLASFRLGGYGDMDIYKITYLNTFNKTCPEKNNDLLTVNSKLINKETNLVSFTSSISDTYKAIHYQWQFNQTSLTNNTSEFSKIVSNTDVGDSVYVKAIFGCDTCIEPIVLCNYSKYQKPKEEVLVCQPEPIKNAYDQQLAVSYLNKSELKNLRLNETPIHFDLNKSNIDIDDKTILNDNVVILKNHPELSILIYGFADSRGSDAYNLKLSKIRAEHVKKYLINKGLNPRQIENVIGKGEQFIINECAEGVTCDDSKNAENRRVEFVIFKKKESK